MENAIQKVELTVDGMRCTLSNGLISIGFQEDGSIWSLKKNGTELLFDETGLSEDYPNSRRTLYVDYHAEGRFRRMRPEMLKIVEQTGDLAHIAYIDAQGLLYIEYHVLLMKGESGYYTYVAAGNNAGTSFQLSEFRTVYRFGSRIFDHACTHERTGLQPTHKYMEQFEYLQDETYRLPPSDAFRYTNGDIYSKYDYAGYFRENPAWGQYGHGFGFFLIPASTEYYPGGPFKQDLLVHYDGIVLDYYTGAHFGTGALTVPNDWKKFYGPYFVYLNEGEDGEALYQDAFKRAEAERAKWPYQFVNHPLYPVKRGSVTGTLRFSDGSPCSNTWVILGEKGGDVERQSAGYLFYALTDDTGAFSLPAVRPGIYTLYAWNIGGSVTEEYSLDGVMVMEDGASLGALTWKLPKRTVLWQLGRATRTAEGFRYGGEQRNHKWHMLPPADATFEIGGSTEELDWYYAQTKPGMYRIEFDLEELPDNPLCLVTALAGCCSSSMKGGGTPAFQIFLNGTLVKPAALVNDSSIYRSATKSGRYRRICVDLDGGLLRKGKNTVGFCCENCGVLYDSVICYILGQK